MSCFIYLLFFRLNHAWNTGFVFKVNSGFYSQVITEIITVFIEEMLFSELHARSERDISDKHLEIT